MYSPWTLAQRSSQGFAESFWGVVGHSSGVVSSCIDL